MSSHESFEQLSALATTGDLDAEQFRQLREHLLGCASCRAAYGDFHDVVERGFPVLERQVAGWSIPKIGLKKRFAARLLKEGITLQRSNPVRSNTWRILEAALLAGLLLIGLNNGWRLSGSDEQQQAEAARQISLLSARIADLEQRQAKRDSEPARVSVERQPEQSQTTGSERELPGQLTRLRGDYEAVVAGKARLEESVSLLSVQAQQLRQDSQLARAETERAQRDLRQAEEALARATRDLDLLRESRSANELMIAEQRNRLDQLTETIRAQTETIERNRQLLSAGKDIRDLMGARDLRIVDVQDSASGNKSPLAGRIFYTRGKSLIFYAYDLRNKSAAADAAFQVWGKRDGRSQASRSLGLLYIDDSTQNRWVLKFEDPQVLAEIDQVFVTVEPPGGSRQPTGKQLLTAAFLNEAPNHP
jgi:outer membrane murein-binding lipoprotein Lpp